MGRSKFQSPSKRKLAQKLFHLQITKAIDDFCFSEFIEYLVEKADGRLGPPPQAVNHWEWW